MSTLTIATYFIFQIAYGFTSHQFELAKRAYPEDISVLEEKMWCENTPTTTLLTVLLLLARVNGVCFLIYFGYTKSWLSAVLLFVVGILATAIIGNFIRRTNWAVATAAVSYFIFPIAGIFVWLTT